MSNRPNRDFNEWNNLVGFNALRRELYNKSRCESFAIIIRGPKIKLDFHLWIVTLKCIYQL